MHISGPGASNTTKIPREDPQRERQKEHNGSGRGKKARNFGPPTLRGPKGVCSSMHFFILFFSFFLEKKKQKKTETPIFAIDKEKEKIERKRKRKSQEEIKEKTGATGLASSFPPSSPPAPPNKTKKKTKKKEKII